MGAFMVGVPEHEFMNDYFDILKWHILIWSVKTLLKTSNNVLFFAPMFPILLSNLWNVIL
jgi:hypothetical protein